MQTSNHRRAGTILISVVLAVLVQVPFAILFVLRRPVCDVRGPGALFFLPAFTLVSPFARYGTPALVATITLQIAITCMPIFWILTWRSRPVWGTLARVVGLVVVLAAATALLIPFEQTRDAKRDALQGGANTAAVPSVRRVNGSLAFFKKKYGEYPERLAQLDFPEDADPVDSRHSGLIQFPLPMQDFFDFSYAGSGSGYQLYVDGKLGWKMYHYCSDESGVIHFDTSRDGCRRGATVYSPH